MHAPEAEVKLSTGQSVPLKSLYEKDRLVLVFLRHFGCSFCKEHVAELRRLPELNIAFVTLGTPEQAEEFRKRMKSPHKFISDPEKELHKMFDVGQGGLAQLINPHTIVRSISGLFKGYLHTRSDGDPRSLPGVFIIEPDGEVAWEYRGRDAADTTSGREIQERLNLLAKEEA